MWILSRCHQVFGQALESQSSLIWDAFSHQANQQPHVNPLGSLVSTQETGPELTTSGTAPSNLSRDMHEQQLHCRRMRRSQGRLVTGFIDLTEPHSPARAGAINPGNPVALASGLAATSAQVGVHDICSSGICKAQFPYLGLPSSKGEFPVSASLHLFRLD